MQSASPPAPRDLVGEVDDRRLVVAGRREHDGARAVAEQNARRAIGVVDDARHDVGADDERVLDGAGRHHRPADAERVREPGTGRTEVEAPGLRRADPRLQQARRARKHHVGRRRADDDEPDVVRREPRLRNGGLGGRHGDIGRRRPRARRCAARGCPVRWTIHSFVVSTIFSRSAFDSTRGGT